MRIAGVNVGEVTDVELDGNMAEVTFTVDDEGLPIHKDATVTIRPRLFLEGNFFLDLQPGSPSAPDLSSGGDDPGHPDRHRGPARPGPDLAPEGHPHGPQAGARRLRQRAQPQADAAEDATQDPDVQGLTGGKALNQTFKYGGKAGRTPRSSTRRSSASTRHDLSNLIRGQRDLFSKLASTDGSLSDLITNFNTTAGALAVGVDEPLGDDPRAGADARAGAPSLRHLEQCAAAVPGPGDRARCPGIRELPATIRAGTPWLVQTAQAARPKNELGGPPSCLAQAGAAARARRPHAALALFPQLGLLSQCVSHNLIPTGNTVIDDAGGAYPFTHRPAELPRVLLRRGPARAARARASTATAPSSASRPAAARRSTQMPNPGRRTDQNESLWAHNISAAARAPARG